MLKMSRRFGYSRPPGAPFGCTSVTPDAKVDCGEENMKSNRRLIRVAAVTLILVCAATVLSAITIRGSSGNGVNSNAPNWLLQGQVHGVTISGNGKKATMRTEIVCPNQDVENALATPNDSLSGTCDSSAYMFVFQFVSTASNVNITLSQLNGFDGTNANNYGVLICDSPDNTIEMCTSATAAQIPDITTSTTTSSVTFSVPGTFPTYPRGTVEQVKGLTFFVMTQQTAQWPIYAPKVAIQ
jgi:hypothetical protein